jgi:hypothetical protein
VWDEQCDDICGSAQYPEQGKETEKSASEKFFQAFALERLHDHKTTNDEKELHTQVAISVPLEIARLSKEVVKVHDPKGSEKAEGVEERVVCFRRVH